MDLVGGKPPPGDLDVPITCVVQGKVSHRCPNRVHGAMPKTN